MKIKLILIFIFIFICNNVDSQQIITVSASTPEIKKVDDILELPASLIANESVDITSVVSEKIEKILFQEGKFVKKDQLLVELTDSEEQAKLRQISAELEEAELNYERAKKLISKGNISQSILDNRIMIKKKLTAQMDEIKAQIEDLKIKAPFDGLTSVRNFSEGSFIKPGDVITNLYDIKKLKVQAYVPENFVDKVKENTEFTITSNLIDDLKVNGNISIIDPLIDSNTRTFKIIGVVDNKKKDIKPGMMINLKLLFSKRNAILLRENSVFNQDNLSYVYLVDKQNKILKKQIEVGSKFNGMIEVLNGIKQNDLVVYEGINKIRDGSSVKVR